VAGRAGLWLRARRLDDRHNGEVCRQGGAPHRQVGHHSSIQKLSQREIDADNDRTMREAVEALHGEDERTTPAG
jgi:hypothetical protein